MESLTKKEFEEIKDEIDSCTNPLIFFHDDPDGLSSFLQIYHYKRAGKGVIIKTTPCIDKKFTSKVEEYSPDKIFVVDIAVVEQEFIDSTDVPIVWIDHHGPYKRDKVKYYNPRTHNPENNPPVAYLMSKALKDEEIDWIAMAGMIGDWFLPEDHSEFAKKYPELLPEDIHKPEDAMFTTEIGKLTEAMSFILKGTTSDAMRYVKIMTRIESPDEILKQSTAQGRYIFNRYVEVKEHYDLMIKQAKRKVGKDNLILFEYTDSLISFTAEVANELLYRHPEKIVIIAREKSGEMKCSLRSRDLSLPPIIEKCMQGLGGRGGGHEHASGAVIKKEFFPEFLKRFKEEISSIKRDHG